MEVTVKIKIYLSIQIDLLFSLVKKKNISYFSF